jgi:hypothetical protein
MVPSLQLPVSAHTVPAGANDHWVFDDAGSQCWQAFTGSIALAV